MPLQPLTPSTSTTGFFQPAPQIKNQFHHDAALQRATNLFLPPSIVADITPDLSRFGAAVLSDQVMRWISDAEVHPPYLAGSGYDAFGRRTDELVTSEGWRRLQEMGLREGIVALGYQNLYGPHDRLVQFLKYHLWAASSAYAVCPSAMQDGAAAVLKVQLAALPSDQQELKDVLSSAISRLTSRDPEIAWTSGQWMTERAGGSDVSGTETIATHISKPVDADESTTAPDGSPLGPWAISGFKWFSSATDAAMTILLARTPAGLSCFFAPTRRHRTSEPEATELNGVRIQRLKSKLGTRALPTAELELCGMRGWLLGQEGRGVKVVAGMLNVTRVHNAVTSVSLLGRGLAIARAYALVRRLPSTGRLLASLPLFTRTLAAVVVGYRADMLLTFFVVSLLGFAEHPEAHTASHPRSPLQPTNPQDAVALLRLLTPIAKARTAKASIAGLQEALESLGGVGYLENHESQILNVARLFRDANVLSIWEGTTDVLATDAIKVLTRHTTITIAALDAWIQDAVLLPPSSPTPFPSQKALQDAIHTAWGALRKELAKVDEAALTYRAREVVQRVGDVVSAVLLVVDAGRDGDGGGVAGEVARRFVRGKLMGGGREREGGTDEAVEWDRRIVFEGGDLDTGRAGARL